MIDDDALGTVSLEPPKSATKKKSSKRKRSEDDEEEPKLDRTVESLERRSEKEENVDDVDDNNSCGDKRGVLSVNVILKCTKVN